MNEWLEYLEGMEFEHDMDWEVVNQYAKNMEDESYDEQTLDFKKSET